VICWHSKGDERAGLTPASLALASSVKILSSGSTRLDLVAAAIRKTLALCSRLVHAAPPGLCAARHPTTTRANQLAGPLPSRSSSQGDPLVIPDTGNPRQRSTRDPSRSCFAALLPVVGASRGANRADKPYLRVARGGSRPDLAAYAPSMITSSSIQAVAFPCAASRRDRQCGVPARAIQPPPTLRPARAFAIASAFMAHIGVSGPRAD
jgi:hypothetical protein